MTELVNVGCVLARWEAKNDTAGQLSGWENDTGGREALALVETSRTTRSVSAPLNSNGRWRQSKCCRHFAHRPASVSGAAYLTFSKHLDFTLDCPGFGNCRRIQRQRFCVGIREL